MYENILKTGVNVWVKTISVMEQGISNLRSPEGPPPLCSHHYLPSNILRENFIIFWFLKSALFHQSIKARFQLSSESEADPRSSVKSPFHYSVGRENSLKLIFS